LRLVSILNETVLQRALRDDVAALQLSIDRVLVQSHSPETPTAANSTDGKAPSGPSGVGSPPVFGQVSAGLRVRGIAVDATNLVLWSGRQVEVYAIRERPFRLVAAFPCPTTAVVLRSETLYCAVGSQIEVCNLHGVVKHKLSFAEAEGTPTELDVNGDVLAVATSTGRLKLFSLKRIEPKALGTTGRFADSADPDKPIGMPVCLSVRPPARPPARPPVRPPDCPVDCWSPVSGCAYFGVPSSRAVTHTCKRRRDPFDSRKRGR
jgi:intraflagellar transport protein 140